MKNFLASLVVLGVCFSASSVSAASPVSTGTPSVVEDNFKQVPIPLDVQQRLENGFGKVRKVVITDKEQLEQIAREEGSEKIPVRIEYEYRPIATEDQSSITAATASTTVSVWDRGNGWYREQADLTSEYRIDGPDTFKISKTDKKSSSYTGNFGASVSVIEASIGFTIGTERTVTFESNTPIAAGQSCLFQLYVTNHRVDYTVHTSTSSTPGTAYDPNGTYIKKTFY